MFLLFAFAVLASATDACPSIPKHAFHLRTASDVAELRAVVYKYGADAFDVRDPEKACVRGARWTAVPVVDHLGAFADPADPAPPRAPALRVGDLPDDRAPHVLVFIGQRPDAWRVEAEIRSKAERRGGAQPHIFIHATDDSPRACAVRTAAGHTAAVPLLLVEMSQGKAVSVSTF